MPKRKRSTSSLSSVCSLPLTEYNLCRLQESLDMPPARSRPLSPTRTKNNLDDSIKLEAYHIYVDEGRTFPPPLAHFIETGVRGPRDSAVPVSPNASYMVNSRRQAAQENESLGKLTIAPFLLFVGEADLVYSGVPGVSGITYKQDISFNKYFLPRAPDPETTKDWGALSSPQPDSCVGYITCRGARLAGKTALFTPNEEKTLRQYCLTQYTHFPFLTAQWKVPNSTENLCVAQHQAARDGAAIVNHLYDMHVAAYGTAPSPALACHFSVLCDLDNGSLWVHWREGAHHYMEHVERFSLRKLSDMETIRGYERNILRWALGERLNFIKATLPKFAYAQAKGQYPAILPVEEDATPSESSRLQSHPPSNVQIDFQVPPTPSENSSDPEKSNKRRRGRDNY